MAGGGGRGKSVCTSTRVGERTSSVSMTFTRFLLLSAMVPHAESVVDDGEESESGRDIRAGSELYARPRQLGGTSHHRVIDGRDTREALSAKG